MSIVSNHYPETIHESNSEAPAKKPRQRKPVARSIRLDLSPFGGNPGVVAITVGKLVTSYFLRTLPSDFGRAFSLEKFGREEGDEVYPVNVNGKLSTCECKGFLKHSHCKHVDGLAALVNRGKL